MQLQLTSDKSRLVPLLASLEVYYPEFDRWFAKLILGPTSPSLVAIDQGRCVGVALGKKTPEECKLRCVRVHPDYQSTGLGIRLMDRMLDTLEHRTPLITVSEELLHQYSRAFVRRYAFSLDGVEKGLYRSGKLEYIFNQE